MDVRLLGPVELARDSTPVPLDVPKERAVLTALALQPGKSVAVEDLITAVWGDEPPVSAPKTLQGYISGLRQHLGAESVMTDPAGYTLGVGREAIDVCRFEDLVIAAGHAAETDQYVRAVELFDEALSLWRGPPLADLADGPLRQGQTARLGELHLGAIESRIACELALGRHELAIPDLEGLVAAHPLRESLWGHLMIALYRAGRQADALRTYQRLRGHLLDELGIEPTPTLQQIEGRILRQDDQLTLDPPPPPTNLPASLSSFVGRADEVRLTTKALIDHRLVTLVGSGGVGKTRIALEVAGRRQTTFSEGVWWVDLASVRDPEQVSGRIASVLGATPAPGMTPADALEAFVRRRHLLLVLDNCEHVLEATRDLTTRLLAAGSGVTILATSRLHLDVAGEFRREVEPMAVPPTALGNSELLDYDSVRLFGERVEDQTGGPVRADDLPVIAELCRRMDGIPLAIEVAATRSRHQTPAQALQHIEDRHAFLRDELRDGDTRHRSLRAALDWSYRLLSEDDRRAFDRLSVFPGDFDGRAFEAVTTDESHGAARHQLAHLVDNSMVSMERSADGEHRYRLLVTARDYAAEHLDPNRRVEAERRHADHFRQRATEAATHFDGPEEREWLAQLGTEDHNLRTAQAWSIEHQDRATTLDFASAMGNASYIRGDMAYCRELLGAMLDGAEAAPTHLRAWAIYRLVWPTFLSGDPLRAFELQQEALDLFEETGDTAGTSLALSARGHMTLLGLADAGEAIRWDRLAIDVTVGTSAVFPRAWAQAMVVQAYALSDRSDEREIDSLLDEAESTFEGYPFGLGHVYMDRGLVAAGRGDYLLAVQVSHQQLEQAAAARNHTYEQIGLVVLGVSHLLRGAPDEGEPYILRGARLALDTGNVFQLGIALQGIAAMLADRGESSAAARCWGAGGSLSPQWPMFDRLYAPYLDRAREALGEAWETGITAGAATSPEDSVQLAFTSLL